ncbi:MAG: Ppx/GppA family phosphatase [Parvibaculaceae bacterium]|nr:Ppx/GppA family phosphatase [Parvibaculaceae bacterium]
MGQGSSAPAEGHETQNVSVKETKEPSSQEASVDEKRGRKNRRRRKRRRGHSTPEGSADTALSQNPNTENSDESTGVSPSIEATGVTVEGVSVSAEATTQNAATTDAPSAKRKRRRGRRRGAGSQQAGSPTVSQADTQVLTQDEAQAVSEEKAPSKVAETPPPIYGALDLGTNNCRLLVAKRVKEGYRVIDAFSRIVRLGEGLAHTGALSQEAMDRAVEALGICADKMRRRGVTHVRTIATEACRMASNGPEFIERVKRETGITLDVVSPEDEAKLAVAGCAPLLCPQTGSALVFDIGGGSTELMWVRRSNRGRGVIEDWVSLSSGVVTLSETYGGKEVTPEGFEKMVSHITEQLAEFRDRVSQKGLPERGFHLLGTSGTVTTIAGVQMGLRRYDRSRVDGAWVSPGDVTRITEQLVNMSFEERAENPCVGYERADLVLAGCAILKAIMIAWPADRLRVADRGLREGILFSLMQEAEPRTRRKRKRRRRGGARSGTSSEENGSTSPESTSAS